MKITKKPTVKGYFTKLGIKRVKSYKKFWESIEKNHGKEVADRLVSILEGRGKLYEQMGFIDHDSTENIYEAKNESLQLSLDFAPFTANYTRNFLEWFVPFSASIKPKRILEIGCDNGLTVCFLALLFPEAEIVGIDSSQNGVMCAKELAEQLEIKNTRFIASDFQSFAEKYGDEKFDMVLSLRVMHEVMHIPEAPNSFSIKRTIEQMGVEENAVIAAVQNLLQEDGIYLSCERLPTVESYAYWAKLLQASGLYIDWEAAVYNVFQDVSGEQRMPIFVARAQESDVAIYEGLVKFLVKGMSMESFAVAKGLAAEYFMQCINPKELVRGLQLNWPDGSGKMRVEIWQSNEDVYVYQFSNLGYRYLERHLLDYLEVAVEEAELLAETYEVQAGTENFVYQTVEERENLDKEYV